MKCQHEGCQFAEKFLICEIVGQEKRIFKCLNHTLTDLNEIVNTIKETQPFHKACECCEHPTSYKVNYGDEGDIYLCIEDVIALLELRLTPEKFKKLYEKYPNHYMLHDDFYDEATGEALQPRKII